MTSVTRWFRSLGQSGALTNARTACDDRRRAEEAVAALETRLAGATASPGDRAA